MGSLQNPPPPSITSGSKILESKARSSSWGHQPSNVTKSETGSRYGTQQSWEQSRISTSPPEFSTTVLSSKLPRITSNPLPLRRRLFAFGELQERASLEEPGTKLDLTPIQKTPEPSSGVDIPDKKTSSSTNSEVESISLISYDGWTAIQSQLKPRVQPQYLGPVGSGLPVTFTRRTGSPESMHRRWMRYSEE